MEKKVYKADDLISAVFLGSTSEVLKKMLVLNISWSSLPLKRFWSPSNCLTLKILTIRYCFSIITNPLNRTGCSFEKIYSQNNISYKENDMISKIKCLKKSDEVWSDIKHLFWFRKNPRWVEIKYLMEFYRIEYPSRKSGPDLKTCKRTAPENLGLKLSGISRQQTLFMLVSKGAQH